MNAKSPRNMVVLMADQHTRAALGAAGHPIVKTPNLDRLCAEGTMFTQAYCNAPICVPSRASLATGRYAFEDGYWDNCTPYAGAQPSWGHIVRKSGGTAVSVGKLHFQSTKEDNGFDPEIIPMHIKEGVGNLFLLLREPLPVAEKFAGLITGSGSGESDYTVYDGAIGDEATRWIAEEAVNCEKPFVLFVSLACPHPPWIAPPEFYDLYDANALPMPYGYEATGASSHPIDKDLKGFLGLTDRISQDDVRRVNAAYYGLVSYMDHQVGLVLSALEEAGLEASTDVLYTSDHGEMMGIKGLFGKVVMYEPSVGVPMILKGQGVPEGRRVDTPVQLADVYPTVLDATGLSDQAPAGLRGSSLFDIAAGHGEDRPIYSEMHSAGCKSGVYMIRKGRFKYVYYQHGYPAQLFDLVDDPMEDRDLGATDALAHVRDELHQELLKIVDPEAIDLAAKASQDEKVQNAGGRDAILAKSMTGYSPAPSV